MAQSPSPLKPVGVSEETDIFPDCPRLAAVFSFIQAYYRQPINLKDVAQEVGYSPAYLTNLVQEETGRSIKAVDY